MEADTNEQLGTEAESAAAEMLLSRKLWLLCRLKEEAQSSAGEPGNLRWGR